MVVACTAGAPDSIPGEGVGSALGVRPARPAPGADYPGGHVMSHGTRSGSRSLSKLLGPDPHSLYAPESTGGATVLAELWQSRARLHQTRWGLHTGGGLEGRGAGMAGGGK